MKKIYLLFYSAFLILSAAADAQTGTWTWISGDSAANAPAIGTLGAPSVNSHPQNIYEALEWKDKQGNFWLYGGFSIHNDTIQYNNTDLWEFNPLNYQWTWVKGGGYPEQPLHGTKGAANAANTPGQRTYAAPTWVDTSGNLWLCGGAGHGDDLWKYNILSNEWTWVAGDTTPNKPSFHGTLGSPGASTTPGNRYSTTSAWTDSANNLWLFGGFGFDDDTIGGGFDDLFKFKISTAQWTWMNGSSSSDPLPVYGIKGAEANSNEVGGRFSYTNWMDTHGDFWIMGGLDYDEIHFNTANDVWKYDIYTNKWVWMSGPDTLGGAGNYYASCTYDTLNSPNCRSDQRASVTDNCGKFWLFGGGGGGDPFDPIPLNDLWVFDPQQVKWNLVNGTNATGEQPGNYGTKGVSSLSNIPPAREGAVAWWGNDNKFYLFGGQGETAVYADVWVFDPDTNCVPSCNSVSIPAPVANFKSSDTAFCAGNCADFTNLSSNATSYQWLFPGAIDSTSNDSTPPTICYTASGNHNVTLVAFNAGRRDSVTFRNYIYVKPLPPAPDIKSNGALLYFHPDTSYAYYQWYIDTTLIPGATDTSVIISGAGNYNVNVTGKDSCKIDAGSNIILGIQNYGNDNSFSLSPNPASQSFTLNYILKNAGTIQINLYDLQGRLIRQIENSYATPGTYENRVDGSAFNLASGMYVIKMVTSDGIVSKKLMYSNE